MKIVKRLFCISVACIMLLQENVVTQAAVIEEKPIEDIVEFLSHNEDGSITLDENGARNAGYDTETVLYVKNNVIRMNELVNSGEAYINESFQAVIPGKSSRAAKGESKVVIYPYGPTQIYLNTDEVADLKKGIDLLSGACTWTALAQLLTSGVAPALGAKLGYIGAAATIGSAYLRVTSKQIEQVSASGKGIIITVLDADSSGTNKAIFLSSQ